MPICNGKNRFSIEYRLYGSTASFHDADPSDFSGLDNLTVNATSNKGCHYRVSASSEIQIIGTFAAYVKKYLLEDANACTNAIECRIYDCVCEKYLSGYYYVDTNTYNYCYDNCVASMSLKRSQKDLNCLNTTLVDTDKSTNPDAVNDWFSGGMNHPTFAYCTEANIPLYFLLAALLSTIIGVVLSGFGVALALSRARGCYKKVKSPYVSTYLRNLADNCGLTLDDTVFTSNAKLPDLECATLFHLQFESQAYNWDTNTTNANVQFLSWTGEKFLNEIVKCWANGKFRIEGNRLVIRNNCESFGPPVLDLRGTKYYSDICCTFNSDLDNCAFKTYSLCEDGLETVGNSAKNLYNDTVEFTFNNQVRPTQATKGEECSEECEIAPVRFRDDGLTPDPLTEAENGPFSAVLSIARGIIIALFPSFIPPSGEDDDWILLKDHSTQCPKILIHDKASGLQSSHTVVRDYTQCEKVYLAGLGAGYGPFNDAEHDFHNWPAILSEKMQEDCGTLNRWELHKCDKPQNGTLEECRSKKRRCTVSISNCDCEILSKFGVYEDSQTGFVIGYDIILPDGKLACIDSMAVDFGNGTIDLEVLV